MPSSKLFDSVKLGNVNLSHRVVLAPLTRFRAQDNHVHSDLAIDYYSKRAQRPGSLLITEATYIAPEAVAYAKCVLPSPPLASGHVSKSPNGAVTDAVHARGSHIVLQLWATGRVANPEVLAREGPYDVVSASDVPLSATAQKPRPLTATEVEHYVEQFAEAAKKAVHQAGFDLVELHGANGYLLDQFLDTATNHRTDAYTGATVEGRIKFVVDAVRAVVDAVGAERTAIRLSPYGSFNGMGMAAADVRETFGTLVQRIPKIAYIHLVEPRPADAPEGSEPVQDIEWLVEEVEKQGSNVILAGGFNRSLALERAAHSDNVLIAFGRAYIANTDLVDRLEKDLPLNPYDRPTFYAPSGPTGRKGYIDL